MSVATEQLALFEGVQPSRAKNPAFSDNKAEPVHRWVPWIAGFSAGFVQECIREFAHPANSRVQTILDPFAGVGTTLVEALRAGNNAIGFEINPYAALAAGVKLNSIELGPRDLRREFGRFRRFVTRRMNSGVEPTSTPPSDFRSRVPFFSSQVLLKVLHCLDFINTVQERQIRDVFSLAFGSVMVSFSNYSYEPSLTTRQSVGRASVLEADVFGILGEKLQQILEDITTFQRDVRAHGRNVRGKLHTVSFMKAEEFVPAGTVDLIVTSPPYLNNYHYVRNTRPQIYWLGLNRQRLMEDLEVQNIGRFWQTVREGPPIGLAVRHKGIAKQIERIRNTNKDRGIYGGTGWANYAAAYYNDTFAYLGILRKLLRRRGTAVIVVGNSIIQGIELHVDRHISDIANSLALQTRGIRLLREKRVGSSIVDSSCRNGNGTKAVLYEAAVILTKG